jgi:hypothetical protein
VLLDVGRRGVAVEAHHARAARDEPARDRVADT